MLKKLFPLKKREVLLLLAALAYNLPAYALAKLFVQGKAHACFAMALDEKIPFWPGMIYIYLGCYLFWAVNYILIVKRGRAQANRLFLAHILGETVSFLFFVLLPTTMNRPQVENTSFTLWLVGLIYRIDSAENLLPSVHCLISWLCWLGVRREEGISTGYKAFSLLFAVAVCVSTVTVKQHVLLDVPAGILLAQISYTIAGWVQKKAGARA